MIARLTAAGAIAPLDTTFDRATAVRALAGGRYHAELSADWGAPNGPNGGYLAALVLRALAATVADDARAPRSLRPSPTTRARRARSRCTTCARRSPARPSCASWSSAPDAR